MPPSGSSGQILSSEPCARFCARSVTLPTLSGSTPLMITGW
jgi:hypothetical protein